jgi:rod shape-determining protein MreC
MLKRPQHIALTAVILLALIVLNLPPGASVPAKLAIGSLFLPLFGLAGTVETAAARVGDAVVPRAVLQAQINKLQEENHQLQLRLLQNESVWQENAQLRQSLGLQRQNPWRLKLAGVVNRDPANWWRTVQIDAGSREGLRVDLPVIVMEGLVGRVAAVSPTHAQIALVGDPNCRVAALVQETRDNGIIAPSSSTVLDPSIVELSYLSRASLIKPGHKVATSGIGGIFPKGIPIGEIVDTRSVGYGLYTEARVKLAANLSRLEYVWVILP